MSAPAGASAHASASPVGDSALNFGPASTLDDTVYGACRPGGAPEGGVRIPDAEVAAWAAAVSARGVTRVVSLLDDAELASYDTPLPEQYKAHFKRCAQRARAARWARRPAWCPTADAACSAQRRLCAAEQRSRRR